MEMVSLTVQILLLLAALWYSYETRKLRIQNLQEVRLVANQGRLALAPYLIPGVRKVSVAELNSAIDADSELSDAEKEERKAEVAKEEVFFGVLVDNPTAEKVACHLEPYIYDPGTKSFLTPDHGIERISPKDKEAIQVTGPYVTKLKAIDEVVKSYGDGVRSLIELLDTPEDCGYVALFFQDIEGTVYLAKRQFILRNGSVSHNSPTKLFCSTVVRGVG
jgi:hypothetical protein